MIFELRIILHENEKQCILRSFLALISLFSKILAQKLSILKKLQHMSRVYRPYSEWRIFNSHYDIAIVIIFFIQCNSFHSIYNI